MTRRRHRQDDAYHPRGRSPWQGAALGLLFILAVATAAFALSR